MSSNRVDNNREAQRNEQKRIEKQALKDSKKNSDQFSKLVSQRQENTAKANQSQRRERGESLKQTIAQKSMKGSNALMARQGIQANKFQQTLANQGKENLQQSKAQVTHRSEESSEIRQFNAEQEQVREKKEMDRNERVVGIHEEEGNSSGGGGAFGGGSQGEQQDRGSQKAMHGVAEVEGLSSPQAAEQAQAPAGSQPIPPHIVKEIVERVFVGVNQEGLNEFTIDLKGTMLEGTTLQISADGAKIYAKVMTNDKNIGRLFKASEGQLARVFGRRGLRLERLDVDER